MFLKELEIQGFKSFADRTRLTFEPGMIAIVGPNGCGKSNVSDAIRWVLGEQRPSALRCSKMQDLIFNGTDSRKPLGMVEVSLLFSDCEQALGTEYREVSIARRAYRSGENAYFLNKTPCRLKDIQRLFMGTGVGTTSYSVMAQGQIDAILSSRPEDRRAVFEEAAGVTKFKADRKEALRKITQTEENLARLTDVLREIKRQSTLLQRQAEKAVRAQTLRTELRSVDLFLAKKTAASLEQTIADAGANVATIGEQLLAIQAKADADQQAISNINAQIQAGEDVLAKLSEQATASGARHSRAKEIIQTNLSRIAEYQTWSQGLEREIAAAREQLELAQGETSHQDQLEQLDDELESYQLLLDDAQEAYDQQKNAVDQARAKLQVARDGLATCDRQQLYYQQLLSKVEAGHEANLLKRERLLTEHAESKRLQSDRNLSASKAEADATIHRTAAEEARDELITLDEDRAFLADDLAQARQRQEVRQRQLAANDAQKEILSQPSAEDLGDAALHFLTPTTSLEAPYSDILGLLADTITIPKEAHKQVETVLAPWARALVVKTPEAALKLMALAKATYPNETLQVLVAIGPQDGPLPFGITTSNIAIDSLIRRLFTNYTGIDTLPCTPPQQGTWITPDGDILYATGDAIRSPSSQATDPLARKIRCAELDTASATIRQAIASEDIAIGELQVRIEAMSSRMKEMQRSVEKSLQLAAQFEGAAKSARKEAASAEEHFVAIDAQLAEVNAATTQATTARQEAREGLEQLTDERMAYTDTTSEISTTLTTLEGQLDSASTRLSEARFRMVGFTQKREHLLAQQRDRVTRLKELESTIEARQASIKSCLSNIDHLEEDNLKITFSLEGLEGETLAYQQQIEKARADRLALNAERDRLEQATAETRRLLSETQETKLKAEVVMTEARLRYQHLQERLTTEYGVQPGTLADEPCATWPDEPPAEAVLEQRLSVIREELAKIGPVNLLAIEEFKQLEERHAFYQTQAEDLTHSRDELLTLIQTINDTSGKMFRETFTMANANFEQMFTRLFHGGEAKLVLLENTEDPLECGIDIIARPPGKKPQTISLLSGGERTMTAVSLLFAIFLIKPAPFCLLDELDAALDDSNIGRFVEALKDFLIHSQFLIITHNQHTIAGSDIVYGVTMPEKGVSKTLSMRFKKESNL